jgi:uncharacterized protein (DUF2141 family)
MSIVRKMPSWIISTAAWCLGILLCSASMSAAAADLTVEIRNVKPNIGVVIVGLYDKPGDFPIPEKRRDAQVVEAQAASVIVSFKGLPAGHYAIAAFQDEKRTGKLEKNFLGIPTEPYGFSNDATGTMGPPSFDAAAIDPAATPNIALSLH